MCGKFQPEILSDDVLLSCLSLSSHFWLEMTGPCQCHRSLWLPHRLLLDGTELWHCFNISLCAVFSVKEISCWWLSARLRYLQCISNGGTAFLHEAIDIEIKLRMVHSWIFCMDKTVIFTVKKALLIQHLICHWKLWSSIWDVWSYCVIHWWFSERTQTSNQFQHHSWCVCVCNSGWVCVWCYSS